MRSLSPSRTLTWTFTVSPARMTGRSASCDFSTSSIAPITPPAIPQLLQDLLLFFVQLRRGQQVRPAFERPAQRLPLPPPPDFRVVPGQQHLGHRQDAIAGTARARNLRRSGELRKVQQ